MIVSIVIPVYNGASTIGRLVDTLHEQLSHLYELDVVLVNDASPRDNSAEVCEALARQHTWITFLDLSRNYGEHNAVMAGLNHCRGDVAVIIDDDFQNPPSEVIKLINEIEKGYDVVFSRYEKKQHHFLRNLGSRFNNLVASWLINKPSDLYLSSFKIINRFVIDQVTSYQGPYPYLDGLILRVTRRYSQVTLQHLPRAEGESNYTLRKLVSLWMNMAFNFSIMPLRLIGMVGLFMAALSALGALYVVVEKVRNPALPIGWASIEISLLVLASLFLVTLGFVGEYVGRVFMMVNRLPQFTVRRHVIQGKVYGHKPPESR
ncbi:glycosyltransferase family 2 protein [Hydrogenophaga bisanensis]|uniref:Glycosyltransferase family 2 protein n=1 Tax=Hydrogenophaga bisanensis TaxID=439611 RepID=A0ABW2RAC9_9BURK